MYIKKHLQLIFCTVPSVLCEIVVEKYCFIVYNEMCVVAHNKICNKVFKGKDMEQSKDKIKNILLYLADVASLFISYILSGWLWLVIYKGFTDEYIVSDKLGIEVGAMIISYAFIILFFNASKHFFK